MIIGLVRRKDKKSSARSNSWLEYALPQRSRRSVGASHDTWLLERKTGNQKVIKEGPMWERISVHTVKRKDTGLKHALERQQGEIPKFGNSETWTAIRGDGVWVHLPEPRVTLRVEGKPVDFMVDRRAQNSVLLRADGPITDKKTWIQDATGARLYS